MVDENESGGNDSPPVSSRVSPSAPSSGLPIVPLLNLVAMVGSLGLLYYTKLVFKRPPITDSGERKRIAEEHSKPLIPASPAFVQFQPQTISIEPYPLHPKPADADHPQIQGKSHYVTVGLSLEIRDQTQLDLIETLRPYILDKLLTLMGKKPFQELNSVQGRYLMQSQIIDLANEVISSHGPPDIQKNLVTNVFFTEFTIQ